MILDGDAARAARREARGKPPVYRLDGRDYTFPVEMPLDVLEISEKAIAEDWTMHRYRSESLRAMLGDEQWEAFRATPHLSEEDLQDVWVQVNKTYAVTEGESTSSPGSSATGGESSKQKSSGSTRKTRGSSTSPEASAG